MSNTSASWYIHIHVMVMTRKLSAYEFSHQFWDSFHCAEPPRPCEPVSSVATSAVRRSSSTWPWQSLDVVPVTNSWSKSQRAHNSLAACLDVAKIPTNLGKRSFDHIPYNITSYNHGQPCSGMVRVKGMVIPLPLRSETTHKKTMLLDLSILVTKPFRM